MPEGTSQTREETLDALWRLNMQAQQATDPVVLKTIFQQAKDLAAERPDDLIVTATAQQLQQLTLYRAQHLAAPVRAKGVDWKLPAATALAVLALVGGAVLAPLVRRMGEARRAPAVVQKPSRPASAAQITAPVQFRTTPPGAEIKLNGAVRCTSNCLLNLPGGSYEVVAALPGYEPSAQTVKVVDGVAATIDLLLPPVQQGLRIVADLPRGRLRLDDQVVGELKDGELSLDRLPAGRHKARLMSPAGDVALTFDLQPGTLPQLSMPPQANGLLAIVFTHFGNQARAYASVSGPLSVDNKPRGTVVSDGLVLSDLSAGDHEIVWGENKSATRFVTRFGQAPTVTAHLLKLDAEAGTLIVETNESKARVTVNGKLQPRLTNERGQLRIPNLSVGDYTVRIAKDGYTVDGPERAVKLAKGQELAVAFTLKAVPQTATLELRGAPVGAGVTIDGERAGTVGANGNFGPRPISPGERTVELSKDGFQTRRMQRVARNGQHVLLTAADLTLEAALGTLKVEVDPADARVTFKRSGETQTQFFTNGTAAVPTGTYQVTATAANHQERTESIQVSAGNTVLVSLKLPPVKLTAPPVATGFAGWEDGANWTLEDGWHMRKGGGEVYFRPQHVRGTLTFTLALFESGRSLKHLFGSKGVRWIAHVTGPGDYVAYQLDDKSLQRRQYVAGRGLESIRHVYTPERNFEHTIRLEITGTRITASVRSGGQWLIIDEFLLPDAGGPGGRFGLQIPKNDTVGLRDFSYQPR